MLAAQMLQQEFTTFPELIAAHADEQPDSIAIVDDHARLSWRDFNARIDRLAARLQLEGVGPGGTVAIAAYNSINYAAALIATLRTGAAAALLTSSATAASLAAMAEDSAAHHVFLDAAMAEKLQEAALPGWMQRIALDDSRAGTPLSDWMAPAGARPAAVGIERDSPFNIIYSSGTTGVPKGIVQSHWMRLGHIKRAATSGYAPDAIAIISTPLYSNTSLVSFIPALAFGGRAVLMAKFDARRFLQIAQAERATHSMLVPVQYRRIMALPDFDQFDLSSYVLKTCTSAPFPAELKAEILRRWPGGLLDIYGMTEGGGTCVLVAHEFPGKLHTVGKPAEGQDIRLINEQGQEVAPGEIGEVVGRSEMMMLGYNHLPAKTREAEWYDAEGRRFIRHGDIGRFDEDGFLVLMDRAKDMIISGGFNIYPSDLEAELLKHPAVAEAAVVGVASEQWGETPVAFVTVRDAGVDLDAVMADANSRLGRTQRISAIHRVEELPRSQIGKVLKRELRDKLGAMRS